MEKNQNSPILPGEKIRKIWHLVHCPGFFINGQEENFLKIEGYAFRNENPNSMAPEKIITSFSGVFIGGVDISPLLKFAEFDTDGVFYEFITEELQKCSGTFYNDSWSCSVNAKSINRTTSIRGIVTPCERSVNFSVDTYRINNSGTHEWNEITKIMVDGQNIHPDEAAYLDLLEWGYELADTNDGAGVCEKGIAKVLADQSSLKTK